MKIGIMTHWWSKDNYGQLLQCFALQKYLHNIGHEAYLIAYQPYHDYIETPFWIKMLKAFNPVKLWRFAFKKIIRYKINKEQKLNPRGFTEFRKKYIKRTERTYHLYSELCSYPPEADVYIVGSDQVWSFHSLPKAKADNVIKAYCLAFGNDKIKRISYAASFGKDDISDSLLDKISPLLQNFTYISVREKSGIDICKKCGIRQVDMMPDPTLLFDAEVYRSLYLNESIRKQTKPYCLLYILGNKCKLSIKKIAHWAKEKGLNIIYVTGNSKYDKFEKFYATIPEWLYLIDNAEYIITNSYHCAIFSLMFHKKFGIISLVGRHAGMNNRFISLFEQFNIQQRFIAQDIDVIENEINWGNINSKLYAIASSCKLDDIL
ncbi:polysaccharide pyruvyl transferase family protein [Treponema primitia]|uniref:polysaccharide pyruvyl transferase family protein n=1 Tax=Treponema primitia TaxID=88058 RepID=UPI0004751C12|nr:polysaccharide pyruvyl transferase family protein [Treponema primitia]